MQAVKAPGSAGVPKPVALEGLGVGRGSSSPHPSTRPVWSGYWTCPIPSETRTVRGWWRNSGFDVGPKPSSMLGSDGGVRTLLLSAGKVGVGNKVDEALGNRPRCVFFSVC